MDEEQPEKQRRGADFYSHAAVDNDKEEEVFDQTNVLSAEQEQRLQSLLTWARLSLLRTDQKEASCLQKVLSSQQEFGLQSAQ